MDCVGRFFFIFFKVFLSVRSLLSPLAPSGYFGSPGYLATMFIPLQSLSLYKSIDLLSSICEISTRVDVWELAIHGSLPFGVGFLYHHLFSLHVCSTGMNMANRRVIRMFIYLLFFIVTLLRNPNRADLAPLCSM